MILLYIFPKEIIKSSCLLSPPLRFQNFDGQVFQVVDLCIIGLPVWLREQIKNK